MARLPRLLAASVLLAALLVPSARSGEDVPKRVPADDAAAPAAAGADSPYYLDRLAADPSPRTPRPEDDIPEVAAILAGLMQDDSVPGFFDGQFAATAQRFDELARLARDRSVHHTLRIMAVMAMPEAADAARMAEVLEPLILPAATEYHLEWQDFRPWKAWSALEEDPVREQLDGALSGYARFALAKAGDPKKIREKIELLETMVSSHADRVLDPDQGWDGGPRGIEVLWYRKVWFDIGYHYQQFDDFDNASRWFQALCDNLRGEDVRWAYYNLACIASLRGQVDEALRYLDGAIESGFADVGWMDRDGDLQAVRERPEYEALRAKLGAAPRESETPNSDAADGEG